MGPFTTFWVAVSALAVLSFVKFPRRIVLFWAGVLTLPVLAVLPSSFWQGTAMNILGQVVGVFALGALLAAVYEVYVRHRLLPDDQSRKLLSWTAVGLAVFAISFFLLEQRFLVSALFGVCTSLGIVAVVAPKILWDFLFSSFVFGALYGFAAVLLLRTYPHFDSASFLSPSLSGMDWFGIPIEVIGSSVVFGALWGPLYAAIKDAKHS